MVDPEEMRRRARSAYERRRGGWIRGLVADGLDRRTIAVASPTAPDGDVDTDRAPGTALEVNLVPPTRREVLRDIGGVGEWVRRWEDYAGPGEVIWEERRWPSVGTQRIPVKVRLADIGAIVRAARRAAEWRLLTSRSLDLVYLAVECGARSTAREGSPDADALPDVVRRLVPAIASTPDGDWEMVLEVLRWLDDHRGLSCYIRELPIRGIDTKWIEAHRKLVLPLAKALLGLEELPFRKAPDLIRARALDEGVLPAGMTDVSLTAAELASLDPKPSRIVVCENLISVLTMPVMEGTLALFGSGYGVGSRLAIPWLDDVELYYWGDLDTHGFRILDGFRKHHPGAISVLMDERTLRDNEDLWVTESEPFTGTLTRLTPEESVVFDFLRTHDPTPRLEQERIPYEQVMKRFASLAGECQAAF